MRLAHPGRSRAARCVLLLSTPIHQQQTVLHQFGYLIVSSSLGVSPSLSLLTVRSLRFCPLRRSGLQVIAANVRAYIKSRKPHSHLPPISSGPDGTHPVWLLSWPPCTFVASRLFLSDLSPPARINNGPRSPHLHTISPAYLLSICGDTTPQHNQNIPSSKSYVPCCV